MTPRGSTGPRCACASCSVPRRGRRYRGADGRRSTCGDRCPAPARVTVRTARVNAVLGSDLDDDADRRVPRAHRVPVRDAVGPGCSTVTVPTFRPDTEREIDVIEEVARHHGYARLPRRRPVAPQVGWPHPVPTRAPPGAPGRGRPRCPRGVDAVAARPRRPPRAVGIEGGVRRGEPAHPRRERAAPEPAARDAAARSRSTPTAARATCGCSRWAMSSPRPTPTGWPAPWHASGRHGHRRARGPGRGAGGRGRRRPAAPRRPGGSWPTPSGSRASRWSRPPPGAGPEARARCPPGLHPTRSARLVLRVGEDRDARGRGRGGRGRPGVLEAFGLDAERRRVGWLEVDLEVLLVEAPRGAARCWSRSAGSRRATSTWPSWWTTPCPPPRWRRRCAGRGRAARVRGAVRRVPGGRRGRRARGAWPTGCGCAPRTGP